jgi:catalase
MWVNAAGAKFWVKYHFHSNQGVEGLTDADATRIAGEDADFHRRDLRTAIDAGDFPSWTLSIQAMPYEDARTYRFNPFDLTKVWPHSDYPLIKVGTMTLNRNPENFFAQIEQAAFEPSAVVPGIGFSPDKMLLGRVFAYSDTHRYRIGANYQQLPVNKHRVENANTYTQDGAMAYEHRGDDPVYAPNSFGRGYADGVGEVEDALFEPAVGEVARVAAPRPHRHDRPVRAGVGLRQGRMRAAAALLRRLSHLAQDQGRLAHRRQGVQDRDALAPRKPSGPLSRHEHRSRYP